MQVLKVTYEIRYPKLLVFRDVYKEIINPYFIYPNAKFSISNEGSYMEAISLTLPDSNNQLHFTNERITFVYDGTFSEMQKDGNSVEICFEIINKLKRIESFLKISKEVIELFALKELSNEENEIISKLANKHKLDSLFDFKDIGVILKGVKDGFGINAHFGFFNGEDDIKAYSILSNNEIERYKLIDKSGISAKVTVSRDMESVSKKTFKEIGKVSENYINKILDNYE